MTWWFLPLNSETPRASSFWSFPSSSTASARRPKSFARPLDEMLSTGALGVLLLFQDLTIDPAEETAALAVSGTCPGIVLVKIREQETLQPA